MKVVNHLLYFDSGKQVEYKPSESIGGILKNLFFGIIHYTGTLNASSAINWMLKKRTDGTSVSAHIHIDRLGNVVQLVPFNRIAWHAGASSWKGYKGLNSYSIGIEISNVAGTPYTDAQIKSAAEVVKALNKAYSSIREWVGHEDIAPGRKVDPGKLFPWNSFRGMVYVSSEQVYKTTADLNIRTGAGVTFPIVSTLPKGTNVVIESDKGEWKEIFVPGSGLKGFVNGKYLTR